MKDMACPEDQPNARRESSSAAHAKRHHRSPLAEPEKRLLTAMAARLPRWILPDHLTLLALVAALVIAAAYALSNRALGWLWLANAGLLLHWLGDSLDGTLARVRRIQRPRYGFYADHLADALATACIGLGLGFSPFMLLAVALAGVGGYLILSINVYLETITNNEFRLGYGVLGPTEARILLVGMNILALTVGPVPFQLLGVGATLFDALGLLAVVGMAAMLVRRALVNLQRLGRLEPPASVDVCGEPGR